MKKILYLDLNAIPPADYVARLKDDVILHLTALVSSLSFVDAAGDRVRILVNVDAANYDRPKMFFNARARRTTFGAYEVMLGGGLLARLDVLAQALAADRDVLRGSRKSKLLDPAVRAEGRQKVMAKFAFYFLLDFVFWHETAHIFLGHVDWLSKALGVDDLPELFADSVDPVEAERRRVLETDADRQSVIWAAASFDVSLKTNPFLSYTSDADAFFDFGVLSAALFMLFDAFDTGVAADLRSHPDNHRRVGVMLAFVEDYLGKYRADARSQLHQQCIAGGLSALQKLLHSNKRAFDVMDVFRFIGETGTRIEQLGFRSFQLKPGRAGSTSFEFVA